MTALPCPACGYLCEVDIPELSLAIAQMERIAVKNGLARHHAWYPRCPGCDIQLTIAATLSPDGVGPERLVPVEVGA